MKNIILVVGLIILIVVSGCVDNSDESSSEPTTSQSKDGSESKVSTSSIRLESLWESTMADGFLITLESTSIADKFGSSTPRGHFIIINLKAKNTENYKSQMSDSTIKPYFYQVVDGDGAEYKAEIIGCGESYEVYLPAKMDASFCVVFDVPKETKKFSLQAKDGMWFGKEIAIIYLDE